MKLSMPLSCACLLILISMTTLLVACQKSTADIDRSASVIPADVRIGVVPFSAPQTTSELIVGRLPRKQSIAAPDELKGLDALLRTSLQVIPRTYEWLAMPLSIHFAEHHEAERPQALLAWIEYGREFKVDFLLVPQILNWRQREGSRAGVTRAAHVRAEFFLIDVRGQRLFRHSVYEEEQVGLVEDFLQVGTFFKRGAGWVTAEELTQEAITKAIDDLGLE